MSVISNIIHRLQHVIGTGRTSTTVNDSGVIRFVQAILGANQTRDNIPVMQHYGFFSNPPPNSDVATLSINGDRSVIQIIGSNHQSYGVYDAGNGAVGLYDMFGNTVVLSSTGIAITSATNLTLNAENIVIHATQSLKYDAYGNGTEFTASTRKDYVTGSTNTSLALSPPQVP